MKEKLEHAIMKIIENTTSSDPLTNDMGYYFLRNKGEKLIQNIIVEQLREDNKNSTFETEKKFIDIVELSNNGEGISSILEIKVSYLSEFFTFGNKQKLRELKSVSNKKGSFDAIDGINEIINDISKRQENFQNKNITCLYVIKNLYSQDIYKELDSEKRIKKEIMNFGRKNYPQIAYPELITENEFLKDDNNINQIKNRINDIFKNHNKLKNDYSISIGDNKPFILKLGEQEYSPTKDKKFGMDLIFFIVHCEGEN